MESSPAVPTASGDAFRWRRFVRGLLALGACALSACATKKGVSDIGHYVVSTPQTPMFWYGPAQSFGPDFNLQQGQHVVMLKREFGYSRVQTDAGQSGYVATEDLQPAPPPKPKPAVDPRIAQLNNSRILYPQVPPMRPTGTSRPGVSSANNRILQGGDLFNDDELPPLPTRDEIEREKKDAKPEFRYPKPKPGFRVNVPTPETTAKPEKADKKEKKPNS